MILFKAKNFLTKYSKYLILFILISLPVFGNLDFLAIRMWDESRLAINAYEMYKNNNFIVTYFDGKPDMWNTKPPLMIWLQVIFMKLIGVNELAIRLPSAIAGFLTSITVYVFTTYITKNKWFGLISVISLISSYGFIYLHSTRTGDYDSLLSLFTTLSGVAFFKFIHTKSNKQLYLFFIFIILAILTKSIVCLILIPPIFYYLIREKQALNLLKNKNSYLGLILLIFGVSSYYLLREYYNIGYLDAVKNNELGGRYLSTLEGHKHNWYFYLENFYIKRLSKSHLFTIIFGAILGNSSKNSVIRQISFYCTSLSLFFLIIISAAKTKIEWYDVPLYPYFSILIGVFSYELYHLTNKYLKINNIKLFCLTLSIVSFSFPYLKIVQRSFNKKISTKDLKIYELAYFLKNAINTDLNLNNTYVTYSGYYPQNNFYINSLKENGITIQFKDWEKLQKNDEVISYQTEIKNYIEDCYYVKKNNLTGNIVKYNIWDKR